jgi:archaellum component FlaC
MINSIVLKLKDITLQLHNAIKLDIEDVKKANHESLVERNEDKLNLMENLSSFKQKLNEQLSKEYKDGIDISIHKSSIDELEKELKDLYYLNGKLASIVLPVKEMYKDIIDELTAKNGGNLIEVMA